MNQLRLSAVEAHLTCGRIEFCHKQKGCASSAYELSEKELTIKLYVPRSCGAKAATLTVFNESLSECVACLLGEWISLDSSFEVYEFSIPLKTLGVGLYFFRPELTLFDTTLYGHGRYTDVKFNTDAQLYNLCQLTVCDFKHTEPKSMYGGVIYHIFVDRFMRGGDIPELDYAKKIDGEWDIIPEYPEYPGAPMKNNTVYGGTLYGIADKLDYISSLGVTAIYLSPIFKSVSNHKYDTADYMTVDEAFGGEAALIHLINKCKEYKIKLILDGVFNHTGDDSIYFNRKGRFNSVGAYQSKDSEYYSWFDFQSHPNKYTCWWDIDILPRINPDLPKCREYFTGNDGVISKYTSLGIYGFRLDVADELSDGFITSVKDAMSRKSKETVLYGEVWEDASNKIAYDKRKRYYLGTELDGVMNYPVRTGIINYILSSDISALEYALNEVTFNAPNRVMHTQMNLLGTHDTERILTILANSPRDGLTNAALRIKKATKEERETAVKRLKAAYTVLATLPGIPAIFYGDEAGLEGYHDPFNRMPYPWGRENTELIEHYKKLGGIRAKNKAYEQGSFKLLTLTKDILIFKREYKDYSYITVFNNSDADILLNFTADSVSVILGKRGANIEVESMAAVIYKLKNAEEIEIVQRHSK